MLFVVPPPLLSLIALAFQLSTSIDGPIRHLLQKLLLDIYQCNVLMYTSSFNIESQQLAGDKTQSASRCRQPILTKEDCSWPRRFNEAH